MSTLADYDNTLLDDNGGRPVRVRGVAPSLPETGLVWFDDGFTMLSGTVTPDFLVKRVMDGSTVTFVTPRCRAAFMKYLRSSVDVQESMDALRRLSYSASFGARRHQGGTLTEYLSDRFVTRDVRVESASAWGDALNLRAGGRVQLVVALREALLEVHDTTSAGDLARAHAAEERGAVRAMYSSRSSKAAAYEYAGAVDTYIHAAFASDLFGVERNTIARVIYPVAVVPPSTRSRELELHTDGALNARVGSKVRLIAPRGETHSLTPSDVSFAEVDGVFRLIVSSSVNSFAKAQAIASRNDWRATLAPVVLRPNATQPSRWLVSGERRALDHGDVARRDVPADIALAGAV